MGTSKRKRKYSQDFSGGSLTDQSFTAACDATNIVNAVEKTGLDPFLDRRSQARYGVASTMSFEEAMRNKADLDSYIAENPDWDALTPPDEPEATTPDAPAEPAPQDSTDGESE